MSSPLPDRPPTGGEQKRPRIRNIKSHNVTTVEKFNSGNIYADQAGTWPLPEAMERKPSENEANANDNSPNNGEDGVNILSYNRETKRIYNSDNVYAVPVNGKPQAQAQPILTGDRKAYGVDSAPVYTEEPAAIGALQHTKSEPAASTTMPAGSSKVPIPTASVLSGHISAPEVPTVHNTSKAAVNDNIGAKHEAKPGDIQKVSGSEVPNVQHSEILATGVDDAKAQHSAVSQVGESQSTVAIGGQGYSLKIPSMESFLEKQQNVTLQDMQNKLAAVARNTPENLYSESLKGLATAAGDICSLIQAKMESQKVTKHLGSLALDCQVVVYIVIVVCEEIQNFDKNVEVLVEYFDTIHTLAIKILKRGAFQKKTQHGKDKTDLQKQQKFLQTWFREFTGLTSDTVSAFLTKMRDLINPQKAPAA